MKREHAKENLEAIIHWAHGGTLWFYRQGEWHKHHDNEMGFEGSSKTSCIIEDQHFEARKAYALGEPIQCQHLSSIGWSDVGGDVKFSDKYKYRVKPKPRLKYQWVLYNKISKKFRLTDNFYETEQDVVDSMATTDLEVVQKYQRSEIVVGAEDA